MRSAWYGAQMRAAKSRTTGFYRPDDPEFSPTRGKRFVEAVEGLFSVF